MAGKKRFARKRKSKRRMKRGAGAKLMKQAGSGGGSKNFKMETLLQLPISPSNTGTNTCALVNVALLNIVSATATSYFTNIVPTTVQNLNFQKLLKMYQEFTCTGVRLKVSFVRDCFDALGTIPVSCEWALDDMAQL